VIRFAVVRRCRRRRVSFGAVGLSLFLLGLLDSAAMTPLASVAIGVSHVGGWLQAGGWVLLASSWIATYVASALMMASTFGRTILPLGKYRRAANVPGEKFVRPLEFELGEPGVKQGQ